MLGSITPLGERGHARRWSATVAHYVIGSVLGGSAVGALFGLLGAGLRAVGLDLSGAAVLIVLAALCGLGVLFDLRVGGLALPTVHRQVNEDWLVRYRGWVIGAGFGFQLGLGVVTIVTTATVYLMLAAALLAGSLVAGLVIGATFGLVRALPLLAARRVDSPPRLRAQHVRLIRWAPRAHVAAVVVQIVVSVLAIGTLLVHGSPGGIVT
ncbi:MAG TPA: sulfite exporter TauE/SafE family protein [Frankiaceae bacterium]|nr:sulfite exporter TauE/SafE family protein [Frankiaceae bacterium]